jgi:hypothetical protein
METGDGSPMFRQRRRCILMADGKEGRRDAHHDFERTGLRRRSLEALLSRFGPKGETMRLRKIAYSLAWLAALAMAVGAGWRPY